MAKTNHITELHNLESRVTLEHISIASGIEQAFDLGANNRWVANSNFGGGEFSTTSVVGVLVETRPIEVMDIPRAKC